MEKIVTSERRVGDLYGLLVDLKRNSFAVKNVASDIRGTYVYLEEYEDKDPGILLEKWEGSEAPVPAPYLYNERKRDAIEVFGTLTPPEKFSMFKRLWAWIKKIA